MSPVPGRTAQTGQQTAAAADEASHPGKAPVKAANSNGSTDGHTSAAAADGIGTNGNETQKQTGSSGNKSGRVADPATGSSADPAADPVAGPVADPAADPVADPVADPAPAVECPSTAGNDQDGELPAETPAEDSQKVAENDKSGGEAVGSLSAGVENGCAVAPPSPQPEGQKAADRPTSPEGQDGADVPTPPPGDNSDMLQERDAHGSEETNGQEGVVATPSGNQEPPEAKNGQSSEATNGQGSADTEKETTPTEATTHRSGLKSGDNHGPLEAAHDQGVISAVSSSAAATSAAAEGADSRQSSAEPRLEAVGRTVQAAVGRLRQSSSSPPGAEAGPEETQQLQPSGSAKNGMTETRSIWLVGSEEHLPGAVGGEEGGTAAASWATVHSTVRAIRVFKRGVSKRLRRLPSQDPQHEPPPTTRTADRQLSHSPAAAAGAAAVAVDPQPEPAVGGFLRSLSFRRSASWRGPLRRGDRQTRDQQQVGGAAAAATGAAGDPGGLDAAMQQTAAPVPLQPHVNRAAFTEVCAAYEPPQKPGGPADDQGLRDKKEAQLKEELRASYYPLDHPSRHQLWSNICQLHGATLGQNEEYESTVRQLEGDYGPARSGQHQTPPFVHSFYMNHYALSEQGVWTAERVMAVLYYNNPSITYAPSLYPVCCLLLHYMDEADTYNALSMMLRNKKQGYLVQTKRDFEISWKILIKLCRKHTKTSLHFLQQEARAGDNVEHVLADWLAWLFCFLPFAHAVRLMDCYLMEGEKVLYRGAMALILLVHKMASHQLGEWAYSFKEFTVQEVMEKFCTDVQLSPEKLLKTMFAIRGFSRDSLTASYARVKAQIKAGGGRLNFPDRRCTRSYSKQQSHPGMGMPSVMSQDELAEASSTIGVKEHSAKYPQLKEPPSSLMSYDELLRLWENLPARYALYTPLLIYTSDEHGFSLKTFYQKVATFEPTVLLLRTTEGAVFGAFCSVTWNMRNESQDDGSRHTYFGTGETFLFTLRPRLTVYPWVGKLRQAEDPELAGLSHSEQLFMAADNTMLTIGGGGGQAIWLDENLSRGKTDACNTFSNPPLTTSGSFDVACMEAFAFSPA